MQIVSSGDNLHEMSILFSGANKENVINLSSAELAQRVTKVNEENTHKKQGASVKASMNICKTCKMCKIDHLVHRLSGVVLCFSSENGLTLKRKNLLTLGANSFFYSDLVCRKAN